VIVNVRQHPVNVCDDLWSAHSASHLTGRRQPSLIRAMGSNEAESRISSSRFQFFSVFRWHIVAEDIWV